MQSKYLFIGAALLLWGTAQAQAYPIYAQRENKTCGYCHVREAGGGPRNDMGVYYATHGHSFKDLTENPLPAGPTLTLAWKQILTGSPSRAAVADTSGDGILRLLLVTAGKDDTQRILSVNTWDAAAGALKIESTVPTTADADEIEVGAFNGEKIPSIVLRSGYFNRDDKGYTFHPARETEQLSGAEKLTGAARRKDGSQVFLTRDATGIIPNGLNDRSDVGEWYIPGVKVEDHFPSYQSFEFRGSLAAENARRWQLPVEVPGPAVFGLWDPQGKGEWFYYLGHHVAAGAGKGDYVAVLTMAMGKSVRKPTLSPALAGKILDLTEGADIRTGKGQGLYVLVDGSGTPGDGRTLYYFALS